MPGVTSDGLKLLANGASVRFKDGLEYRLVFDWEALLRLEQSHTLQSFADAIDVGRTKFDTKRLQAIDAGLVAALSHYRDDPLPDGATRELAAVEWRRLFDFRQVADYLGALNLAFVEAMPMEAREQATRLAGSRAPGRTGGSPGASSTTPPSSAGTSRARVAAGSGA